MKVVKSKDDLGIGKVYEKDKGEYHFKIHFKSCLACKKLPMILKLFHGVIMTIGGKRSLMVAANLNFKRKFSEIYFNGK